MAMTVHLTMTANGEPVEGESIVTTLDRADTIECFSFEYGVMAGSEAFTGGAAGVRNYEPIRIVKRVDKSTPLLWKALCNNEDVEGTFRFFRPDPAGQGVTEHFFTVEITEARVTGIDFSSPDAMGGGAGSSEPPTEVISFVYNNMTQTYEATGAAHQDTFQDQA